MKLKMTISFWLVLGLMLPCYAQDTDLFSKLIKVADKKGELIVCDHSLLKETVVIPLSTFVEELQMVKLDNADEALVMESSVEISNNYFLIKGERQIPYKLFNKKTGKFITNIGAFGQGPGEYQFIYDHQLDEENDRIYLLPWQAKGILEYNLKGEFLRQIPLCFGSPKGNFKVDTKAGTLIVSVVPFQGTEAVVWEQTIKGEVLKSIHPNHLAVPGQNGFNNETSSYKQNGIYGFNVFTFKPRIDSVYHYDKNKNILIPVFTMNFKTDNLPIHSYYETKRYFMGDFAEEKKLNETTTTTQNHRFYFVDKQTLKGSFFTLENDYLGGINIEWPVLVLSGEYYVYNVEPANLREKIDEVLSKNNKLTSEMKAKLAKLKDSISDNDNNYIFYAKIK